nr:protease inhibitor I42 family protein [Microbacterium hydrocarbonoxydans]
MREARRVAATVMVAVAFTLALGGCVPAIERHVEHTSSSVSLSRGEALVVEFGEVNPSVGDDWVLTREPDPAVLGEGDERYRYLGEDGETGSPSEMTYRFAAIGVGTTVVRFEYRFRGSVPEDPANRKSAEIAVTVK